MGHGTIRSALRQRSARFLSHSCKGRNAKEQRYAAGLAANLRCYPDWAGLRVDRKPLIALTFQFSLWGIPPMSKPAKTQNTPTFESALAELENIVAGMEQGQMPLEQSLAAYKRGAELLKFCQAQLADAQQQVKILEDGVLKNFGVAEQ